MQIKIINQNGETLQILKNVYNLNLQDEVFLKTQGSEILSFDIVWEEGKSLKNESLLEVNNRVYRVKSITELKGKTLVKHIEAEGLWYELIDKLFAPHLFNDKTISEVITIILENTGWVAGDIIITPARDLLINEEITVLQALSKVQEAYGGIFHFDTKNKVINVYETIPNEKNLYFQYGKNIVEIEKIINTNNLVTRLYVEGKDGLTIETVNNGIPYIENFDWFIENGFEPEIREYKIKNENITNPQRLLEYAQDRLLDLSKPEISYNVKIAETEELPKLGERVIIRDKDIEMDIESVVIKRDIDLLKPWNSVITLNTKVPELATQIIQFEEGQITEFDKQPPSPPTNLQLTTVLMNNESYVIADFDSSPELDVIGYEIAYSYDEEFWETVIVTEPPANVKVTPGKLVFVRVRAYDIEGFKSEWTLTESIVSTQDIIPPARPSFITAKGLFQKIKLEWTKNTEEDFKEYHIQVSGTEDFANILNEYYLNANYMVYSGQTNTTYYFRVSAIDTSLNESDWSHVASATTAAVYDEDIESAIIEEMENNLDTLNNETLPALQEDLSMLEDIAALEIPASFTMLFTTSLQDDLGGVVPEGYAPLIQNGDFINTNLNRELKTQLGLINENITQINNLITQTEDIETNIENINGTITNIQTTVDTHTSQISQTISDVTALAGRVTSVEGDITTIEQTVGQIQTTVTSHETRISDAETTLVSYGTQITQNANSISSIATRVTDTETNITAIIQDVDSIESTVVSHSDTLETHATSIQQNANSITSIVADIEDINTNISSITQTVDEIQLTVSSHTTELGTLSTQVTQNADSITTVVSRVDTAETNISQIQQDIDSIELSVTSITGDISDINSNITTLDSRITIAEGNITSTVSRVTSLETNVTAIIQDVDSIESIVATHTTKLNEHDNTLTTHYSLIQQNSDSITSTVANVEMLEDIAALEIPTSFTMLFTTSLQDDISGVTPEGYEPVIRNGDFINTNLNRMIEVHETRITQTENDITLMALDIDGLETNFSQLQVTVNGINATVISQGETLDTHASQIQQLSNQITFAVAAVDENGNPVTGASLVLTADGKIKATADKFIVDGDVLVNGSITASKLGADSVTANAIGANQIITNVANIKNGVIETAHIKDAAISSAKIADAAITNAKIGTAAVDTANIADLAVTNAKINDINAEKITAGIIKGYTNTTKFDLDHDLIQVGNNVKMGKGVLPDTSDGLYIENGRIMVKNPSGTVVIDGTKNMLKILLTGIIEVPPNKLTWFYFDKLNYAPIFLFYDVFQSSTINYTAATSFYKYMDTNGNLINKGLWAATGTDHIRFLNYGNSNVYIRYYIFQEIGI